MITVASTNFLSFNLLSFIFKQRLLSHFVNKKDIRLFRFKRVLEISAGDE